MNLPIDTTELEFIVMTLWRCRKSDPKCNSLYERLRDFDQDAIIEENTHDSEGC